MDESIQLLLACLDYSGTSSKKVNFDQASLAQWEKVLEKSKYHQTTPLLYDRTKQLNIALPDSIQKRLRDSFLKNFYLNTRLYHQLQTLSERWQEKSIPAMALKGAYLAGVVYDNIGLRVMSDVDILVRKEHVTEAALVLTEAGYQKKVASFQENVRHFHDAYTRQNSPSIELHWTLNETFTNQVDLEEIWSHALPVTILYGSFFALPQEELLVFLCMHTIQHINSAMLRMLCDVGEVVRKFGEELQWDKVVETAFRWDIPRAVYVILRLAGELLQVPIPQAVLKALEPQDLEEKYLNFMRDRFVGTTQDETFSEGRFSRWLSLLRNGWRISVERVSVMYSIPKGSWRIYGYLPSFILKAIGKNRKIIQSALFIQPKKQEQIDMKYQCMAVRNWLLTGKKTKLRLNTELGSNERVDIRK